MSTNDLNKAALFFAQGHTAQAEQLYRDVLKRDPDNASAHWGLGRVAMRASDLEAAAGLFRKAIKALPTHPLPMISLGDAYSEQRKFDQAGECYAKAAALAPENAFARYTYGVHLAEAGEHAAATKEFRAALKLDPTHGHAYSSLARLKSFTTRDDTDIEAMEALLARGDLAPASRMAALYGLGKAYDDLGDIESAFRYFAQANKSQRARASFSVSDMKPFFERLKRVFSPDVLANKNTQTEAPLTPIFIVGQPRSGSTLLEQILGRHSEIFAAGELPFFGREVVQELTRLKGAHFPEACLNLQQNELRNLAKVYLDTVGACAPDRNFVTDKSPSNYQSIGLISMIMPEAKIINIRRHPMDMGLSIFKNFFNEDEPYFCSLEEIGQYHRFYEDLMAHWRALLPNFVLDLQYEDLVADPKKTATRVLAFCGLEWMDPCLDFSQAPGHVRTLSQIQVRDAIGRDRVGAWKHYEKYLSPLQEALGDSIEKYEMDRTVA